MSDSAVAAMWSSVLPGESGALAVTQGRLADAVPLLASSVESPRRKPGWAHDVCVQHDVLLVETLADLGRTEAALSTGPQADELFTRAEQDIAAGVEAFALAGTHLRHARWLRRHRRRGDAAFHLRAALAGFEQSPRTVEVHLTHAYRKLHVTRRRDLARDLADVVAQTATQTDGGTAS